MLHSARTASKSRDPLLLADGNSGRQMMLPSRETVLQPADGSNQFQFFSNYQMEASRVKSSGVCGCIPHEN